MKLNIKPGEGPTRRLRAIFRRAIESDTEPDTVACVVIYPGKSSHRLTGEAVVMTHDGDHLLDADEIASTVMAGLPPDEVEGADDGLSGMEIAGLTPDEVLDYHKRGFINLSSEPVEVDPRVHEVARDILATQINGVLAGKLSHPHLLGAPELDRAVRDFLRQFLAMIDEG